VSPATRFRLVALLAIAGLFASLYMLLYHLGFYGVLACGPGSCDVVQASKWARFLGIPVSAWGLAWYGAVLVLALVLQAGRPETGFAGRLLGLAAVAGLAFSAYLTALELFVIHAVCSWCVVSAALAVAIFLLAAPWRAFARRTPAPS
jgi:uncharacterized membrane protein